MPITYCTGVRVVADEEGGFLHPSSEVRDEIAIVQAYGFPPRLSVNGGVQFDERSSRGHGECYSTVHGFSELPLFGYFVANGNRAVSNVARVRSLVLEDGLLTDHLLRHPCD